MTIFPHSTASKKPRANQGAAYVFVRTNRGWTEQAMLTASDGEYLDLFGWSVAISGETIVIGAWGHDDPEDDSGSGYVFVRTNTGWNEQAKLSASDSASRDHFGASVAISGETVVVGSSGNDDNGLSSGSAYLFDVGQDRRR
jgi:hypothetical protein